MPSAIPQSVINVKEKDTGKPIAHHALELKFSVTSEADGDTTQPSVQARGKARVIEAKVRVMEAKAGATAKEIGATAKEIGAKEVSRDRD